MPTAAAAPSSRSRATSRSRAPRCSPTRSSSGPPRRSPASPTAAAPRPTPSAAPHPLFAAARSVLSVGIGGGGDVVGALATADLARAAGLGAHVGGVTWERRPIDPHPGPRRLDEAEGLVERLGAWAALAGPETCGPGPF